MQIEDIARICFTSRRTLEQQRKGTVSDRVLGEIIVDDEDILALIGEILAHRAAGIRRDVLQRGKLRSRCGNDNRIGHCLRLCELLHDIRNG